MATFNELPTELQLGILERMPDFRTLHALVHASKQAREVYHKYAYDILSWTLKSQNYFEGDLMASAAEACLAAKGQLYCTVREAFTDWNTPDVGRIFTPWPGRRQAAREKVLAGPFRTLQKLADLDHESAQVAKWCWENRMKYDPVGSSRIPRIASAQIGEESLGKAYWHLRSLIDRCRKFDSVRSVDMRHSGVDRRGQWPLSFSASDMIMCWLVELYDEDLLSIGRALDSLKGGSESAMRHGLSASEDALVVHLFGQPGVKAPIVPYLPEKVNAELSRRGYGPSVSFFSVTEARNLLQAMARPLSDCTKLTDHEVVEYNRALARQTGSQSWFSTWSTNEEHENFWPTYIDRFRPLLGLPYGTRDQASSSGDAMGAMLDRIHSAMLRSLREPERARKFSR